MFESLVETNTEVKVVRRDGASALALSIFSNNTRILNHIPKVIEYDGRAESSYVRRLPLAFLAPNNVFGRLKDGQSPRELLLRRGFFFDDISSGVSPRYKILPILHYL
jgi:hypothetical protein